MITLTDEQNTAITCILEFICNPDKSGFVFSGPAGTGKTTVLAHLLDELSVKDLDVYLTATTNKAARVAAKMSTSANPLTVHSLLKLKPTKNDDGTESLKSTGMPCLAKDKSVIIIDEASMVSKELMKAVKDATVDFNAKALFVGDAYQLPPVGEEKCPIFDLVKDQFHLTKVHRQAEDNPLLSLATKYRKALDNGVFPRLSDHDNAVTPLSPKEFTEKAIALSVEAHENDHQDAVKVLAWTNARVRHLNAEIRRAVYGDKAQQNILPGERLIVNSPVTYYEDGIDKIIFGTDDEIIVEDAWATRMYDVDGYTVRVEWNELFVPNDWKQVSRVLARHRGTAQRLQREANNYKKSGKVVPFELDSERRSAWVNYFGVKSKFCDMRPPFACTVHKSQGSTYDNVLIDFENLGFCKRPKDLARLGYVALTRPRYKAFTLGDIPNGLTQQ